MANDKIYRQHIEIVDKASDVLGKIENSAKMLSQSMYAITDAFKSFFEKFNTFSKIIEENNVRLRENSRVNSELLISNLSLSSGIEKLTTAINTNQNTMSELSSEVVIAQHKLDVLGQTQNNLSSKFEEGNQAYKKSTELFGWAIKEVVSNSSKLNEVVAPLMKVKDVVVDNTHTLITHSANLDRFTEKTRKSTDKIAEQYKALSPRITTLHKQTGKLVTSLEKHKDKIGSITESIKGFSTEIKDIPKSFDAFGNKLEKSNAIYEKIYKRISSMAKPFLGFVKELKTLNNFLLKTIVTQEKFDEKTRKLSSRIEQLETKLRILNEKFTKQNEKIKENTVSIKKNAFETALLNASFEEINKTTRSFRTFMDSATEGNYKFIKSAKSVKNSLGKDYKDIFREVVSPFAIPYSEQTKIPVDASIIAQSLKKPYQNLRNFMQNEFQNQIKKGLTDSKLLTTAFEKNLQYAGLSGTKARITKEQFDYFKSLKSFTPSMHKAMFLNMFSSKYVAGEIFSGMTKGVKGFGDSLIQLDKALHKSKIGYKSWYFTLGTINRFINLNRFIFQSLGRTIDGLTKPYKDLYEAQTRLEATTSLIAGNTKENTQALIDQANAMSKVTNMTAEQILMGQSQIATFRINNQSIKDLTETYVNMTAGIYGVEISQENLINSANMIGKAFQGQFGQLQRNGILISDAQKKAIRTGKETEKVAIFNQIIAENFGKSYAQIMSQTPYGRIKLMQNSFKDMTKDIGQKLVPSIMAVKTQWYSFITSYQFKNFLSVMADGINKIAQFSYVAVDSLKRIFKSLFGSAEAMKKFGQFTKFAFRLIVTSTAISSFLRLGASIANTVKNIANLYNAFKLFAVANPILAGSFLGIAGAIGLITWQLTKSPQAFDKMKKGAEDLSKRLKYMTSDLGNFVKTVISDLVNGILGVFYLLNKTMDKFKKQVDTLAENKFEIPSKIASALLSPFDFSAGAEDTAKTITKIDKFLNPNLYKKTDRITDYDQLSSVSGAILENNRKNTNTVTDALSEFEKMVQDFKNASPLIPKGEGLALDDLNDTLTNGTAKVNVVNPVDLNTDYFDDVLKYSIAKESSRINERKIEINITGNNINNREDIDYLTQSIVDRMTDLLSSENTTKGVVNYYGI